MVDPLPSVPTVHDLVRALSARIGRARGVSALALAGQLACTERQVRRLVTQARTDGIAVCGRPRSGYFIAATAQELEDTCRFLRARAMRSLQLEARLRRVPLPDLIGQLRLRT